MYPLFIGMTQQGKDRKRRVCQKIWHQETSTKLQLSVYIGVLAILKEYTVCHGFPGGYLTFVSHDYNCWLYWTVFVYHAYIHTFFLTQGSETLVHKLHEKQLELFMSFLACFVKGEHITALSPRALVNLVLEDHMILPAREIYVVQDADAFRSKTSNHAVSTLQQK